MAEYGLCGKTLKHSYSEIIHNLLGNERYTLLNMTEDGFYDFMKRRDFRAVNVTIPYKTDALWCADVVSPEAKKICSVNTVVCKNGVLYGYNTDYFGFCYMLDSVGIDARGKKAMILGTGGTSLTARQVLSDRGASEIVIVSRQGKVNYENLYDHADTAILVNTTPVGMYPNNGQTLVDLARFPALSGVVDVIYNPLKTALIYDAEMRGITAVSGLSMLVAQAVMAHELFFDAPFGDRDAVIRDILKKCTSKVSNLVLVGMPGSGKTTVGKKIAERCGKPFYDSDIYLEEKVGRSIPDILKTDGEAAFRRLESEVLEELTKRSGCVIATGGGAVLAPHNRSLLRQNGVCVYITRDTEKLATGGRPLSQGGTERLKALFAERDPIYREVCDFCEPTGEDTDACAERICEKMGF